MEIEGAGAGQSAKGMAPRRVGQASPTGPPMADPSRSRGAGVATAHALRAQALLRGDSPDQAAAVAELALDADPANGLALSVVAQAHAAMGRHDASLDARFRLARAASLSESALWDTIEALIGAGRHSQALIVLDERDEDLDPVRATLRRVDALLAQGGQGRQRAALTVLSHAAKARRVEAADVVAHLLGAGALALAASFLHRLDDDGPSAAAKLRVDVSRAARAVCRQATLQEAPFEFADAVRALQILNPEDATMAAHVRRAATVLSARLKRANGIDDFAAATGLLIRLARLAPTDLEVLEQLAVSAAGAGRTARQLDTLVRIHAIRGGADDLRRACELAFRLERWAVLAQVVAPEPNRAREALAAQPRGRAAVIGDVCDWARETLDALLAAGEPQSALELAAAMRGWMTPAQWPAWRWSALLSRGRRALRAASAGSDATAAARLAGAFLAVEPRDADMARLLARLYLRLRRFVAARAAYESLMTSDPHCAADWTDLATVCRELGDDRGADVCAARAALIDPAVGESAVVEGAPARLARS